MFTSASLEIMDAVVGWLLEPVIAGLLALVALAIWELGLLVGEGIGGVRRAAAVLAGRGGHPARHDVPGQLRQRRAHAAARTPSGPSRWQSGTTSSRPAVRHWACCAAG